MKSISCSLNNVKSRYFMLLACLSLLLATTSCNNYATRSKLTNLICEKEDLKNLFEVRIESTPWEKDLAKMVRLGELLPNREDMAPGHLYTYSLYIDSLRQFTNPNNWLINR